LEGFTNPSKQGQLSVFDRRGRRWFEASAARVGAEKGFYDYSLESMPDQTADEAFSGLESKFPVVRNELIAGGFTAWGTHRETQVVTSIPARVKHFETPGIRIY
jgi:hypothetical protein